MYKDKKFDFMLNGCHPFSEISKAYFPSNHTSSSTRSMHRYIQHCPALLADLQEVDYDDDTHMLTPAQIRIIIHHMGMPAAARAEVEKMRDRTDTF